MTIGHNACVHGAKIKDHVLIGMGSTVLDNAEIGRGAVVAAGALVLQGTVIGDYELWGGVPAKLLKRLSPEASAKLIDPGIEHYVQHAHEYLSDDVADV